MILRKAQSDPKSKDTTMTLRELQMEEIERIRGGQTRPICANRMFAASACTATPYGSNFLCPRGYRCEPIPTNGTIFYGCCKV
ncbi:MAG: hypothetical protein WBB28_06695 [Crinalium sp.]